MAIHPVNDRFKVKSDTSEYKFIGESGSSETGVVIEIPDVLLYLSFHSFAFEDSIANDEKLEKIQKYYNQFLGKRIFWESFQDKGRRLKEPDGEYVYLQMTDILCYSDDVDVKAQLVEDTRSGGFKI